MALTVSVDTGLMGQNTFVGASARKYGYMLGRLTGTYGGALTTLTVSGMRHPIFVNIPPVSTYAFQYNPGTSEFAVLVQGASASNSNLATSPTSIDLACFTCYFEGTTTVGVVFAAFGW